MLSRDELWISRTYRGAALRPKKLKSVAPRVLINYGKDSHIKATDPPVRCITFSKRWQCEPRQLWFVRRLVMVLFRNSFILALVFASAILTAGPAAAACVTAEMPRCDAECDEYSFCLPTTILEYKPRRLFGIPVFPNWAKVGRTCFCRKFGLWAGSEVNGSWVAPDGQAVPEGAITLDEYLNELIANADALSLDSIISTGW